MPDAYNDRNRKLRYLVSQFKVVKRIEFGRRPTATNDDHAVKHVDVPVNAVQRCQYRGNRLRALHDSRKQTGIELQSVRIMAQLVHEVAISGGSRCRNNRNALRHIGPRQLHVHLKDACLLKAVDDFLSLALHVAHGVAGVDVVDDDLDAVEAMECCRHVDQHLHARSQNLARGFKKLVIQVPVIACPDGSPHLGNGRTLVILLDEFSIAVAAAVQAQITSLGNDPLAAQPGIVVQHLLDAGIKLTQGHALWLGREDGRLLHSYFFTGLIFNPLKR